MAEQPAPSRGRRRTALVAAVVPFIVGTVFVTFAVLVVRAIRVEEGWRTTEGVVVREIATKTRKGTVLTQIVRYEVNGESRDVERTLGNTSNDSIIGRTMEVAYDPKHPEDAKVLESILGSWLVGVFFVIGLFLLGGTVVNLARAFRHKEAVWA